MQSTNDGPAAAHRVIDPGRTAELAEALAGLAEGAGAERAAAEREHAVRSFPPPIRPASAVFHRTPHQNESCTGLAQILGQL